jgi:hypothetical protein
MKKGIILTVFAFLVLNTLHAFALASPRDCRAGEVAQCHDYNPEHCSCVYNTVYAQAAEPSLDGKYTINMKIGNHSFVDEMEIQGQPGPILLKSYGGDITGNLTVPGAFTSGLTGNAKCTMWGGFCELQFQIMANEQNQSYRVYYQATLPLKNYNDSLVHGKPVVLSGSAYLEDGKLLGQFQAFKNR